jgi:hypothetical protein
MTRYEDASMDALASYDRRAELGPVLEDDEGQGYLDSAPADTDAPAIPGLERPPAPREET